MRATFLNGKGRCVDGNSAPISKHSIRFCGGVPNMILINSEKKAKGSENILVLGHKPHKTMPVFLKAADVLVLPNSAKEEISRSYTSPLKLFEYMASGRPIVASDLPSIREVLNENNSLLVSPDSSEDCQKA